MNRNSLFYLFIIDAWDCFEYGDHLQFSHWDLRLDQNQLPTVVMMKGKAAVSDEVRATMINDLFSYLLWFLYQFIKFMPFTFTFILINDSHLEKIPRFPF